MVGNSIIQVREAGYGIRISPEEYNLFKQYLYQLSGIDLGDTKQSLVTSRLQRRLLVHGLSSYREYFEFIQSPGNQKESQFAINLLTTNETFFFREVNHFNFLMSTILPAYKRGPMFRVWSAASSTGEEAYSVAMILDDVLGARQWEVFGSDINTQVLEQASTGHYSVDRIDGIPKDYLKRYCLKGKEEYQNTMLISAKIRSRVKFASVNLCAQLPDIGCFQVIFLRNVLIYFDRETQLKVIRRITTALSPGGYLFLGHSESIKGFNDKLRYIAPATYQKVEASHDS